MTASRWRRYLAELAEQYGAVLEPTRAGHYRLRHPSDGWIVHTSGTPSDERSTKHTAAQVRREVALARWMPRVEP